MAAGGPEKDDIREQIEQELSGISLDCSSLVQLSGGTANFVYRGTLHSPADGSIIIKHSKDYLASDPNFKLDAARCVSSHLVKTPVRSEH